MIREYKLYHGAVLADLVDRAEIPITIEEQTESGRLLNYIINGSMGLQIKFSTNRLNPWSYTFQPSHTQELVNLKSRFGTAFLVLVCGTDGMLAVEASEVIPSLQISDDRQGYLRVDRRKRGQYRLTGSSGEFKRRYPTTTEPIVDALNSSRIKNLDNFTSHSALESITT